MMVAELDPREASRRRRAVYTALKPFMSEAQALSALRLWERDFSTGPVYVLHSYVNVLCGVDELKQRHGEIYRALMRALTAEEEQLLPDPVERMALQPGVEPPPRGAATPAGDCNAVTVFVGLAERVLKALEEIDADHAFKLRVEVMETAAGLGLPARQSQAVSRWIMQQPGDLPCDLAEPVLRQLLHQLYVGGCEHCGPVRMDALMGEAVKEVEALPAAQVFPPRRLL